MTQTATAEKKVQIYHTGDSHGPLETAFGILKPGLSIEVPESLAGRLTRAYPHIKLTAELAAGGAKAHAEGLAEKAKLESGLSKALEDLASANAAKEALKADAQKAIDDLVKLKEEANARANAAEEARIQAEKGEKTASEAKDLAEKALAAATPENLAATLGSLQGIIREFLAAENKKDLDALKAKHKDSVPAAE